MEKLLIKKKNISIDYMEMKQFIITFTVETLYDQSEICKVYIDIDIDKLYSEEITPLNSILNFISYIKSLLPDNSFINRDDVSVPYCKNIGNEEYEKLTDSEKNFQHISLGIGDNYDYSMIMPPIYIKNISAWTELLNILVLNQSKKTIKIK